MLHTIYYILHPVYYVLHDIYIYIGYIIQCPHSLTRLCLEGFFLNLFLVVDCPLPPQAAPEHAQLLFIFLLPRRPVVNVPETSFQPIKWKHMCRNLHNLMLWKPVSKNLMCWKQVSWKPVSSDLMCQGQFPGIQCVGNQFPRIECAGNIFWWP